MDRQTANRLLAAILETVAEGPAPSGVMYAAMQSRITLDEYQGLIQIAESVGLVTIAHHEVTIHCQGKGDGREDQGVSRGVTLASRIRAHAGQRGRPSGLRTKGKAREHFSGLEGAPRGARNRARESGARDGSDAWLLRLSAE
jgi:hypothetical protein